MVLLLKCKMQDKEKNQWQFFPNGVNITHAQFNNSSESKTFCRRFFFQGQKCKDHVKICIGNLQRGQSQVMFFSLSDEPDWQVDPGRRRPRNSQCASLSPSPSIIGPIRLFHPFDNIMDTHTN